MTAMRGDAVAHRWVGPGGRTGVGQDGDGRTHARSTCPYAAQHDAYSPT
ncbi:MAG TPA: hypothetical protein VIE19_00280 [Lapillicoccus sp.]